ncbi:MAG TPA: sugar transferase [Ferruginibacter sp.]|nr:hypothetical protein [Chitinophagaceae bacterium]HRI23743.1 sugar transferase [Ferruginibacter sp.]
MQNELNPAGIAPVSNREIVDEKALTVAIPLVRMESGPATVIDIRDFVTPIVYHPLEDGLNLAMKRAVDIMAAVLFIVAVLSWLIPLMAILIKLDSKGPVFFLQKRNKRRGELFSCIKFRSMVGNADADILPAGKNDSRITRIGRFLRRYHLDELPQFINVLLGDMSIIGPRPHMVSENLKFDGLIKNYNSRHKVKPGITGLAQVMGYVGETDNIHKMKKRVNMDIFYIRHWSLWLDITILFRTLRRFLAL